VRAQNFLTATGKYTLPPDNKPENDLWVREGEHEQYGYCISSVWVPTDEERERIAAGENIELTTLGHGTPPLMMNVTGVPLIDSDNVPND
jgi:hypothetical protein